MNRPNTDEFWLLSELLITQDNTAEALGLKAAVQEVIDLETLAYVAEQRTFRVLGIFTEEQLQAKRTEVAKISAIWMDAFLIGVKYERKRNENTDS